jgi:hypothetical protein
MGLIAASSGTEHTLAIRLLAACVQPNWVEGPQRPV